MTPQHDRCSCRSDDNSRVLCILLKAVACGDRHCCGIAAQTSLQALNLRQEDLLLIIMLCSATRQFICLQCIRRTPSKKACPHANIHSCSLVCVCMQWYCIHRHTCACKLCACEENPLEWYQHCNKLFSKTVKHIKPVGFHQTTGNPWKVCFLQTRLELHRKIFQIH